MRGQLSIEARQRSVITRLKNANKRLRQGSQRRIKSLEEENTAKDKIIETLLVRVAELEEKIFGSKKDKADKNDDSSDIGLNSLKKDKKSRDPSSFRRSAPQDYEITKEETFKIDTCPD